MTSSSQKFYSQNLMKVVVLVVLVGLIACSPGIACLTQEQKRLEHATVGDHSPEWMPDGSAIVALSDFQLWMAPVDGSSNERVGSDRHDQLKAAISRSGALAYTESRRLNRACRLERGCRESLLKIARWGPESTRANPALQVTADYDMAWSADDRLAAVSGYGGATTLSTHEEIYAVVRPFIPGEEIPQPLRVISAAKGPAWSPDGRFVASMVFAWTTHDTEAKFLRWYLFVLGAEGVYQKVFPLSAESEDRSAHAFVEMSTPAWSLDGKRVYFATPLNGEDTPDGVPTLFAVELATGEIQAIAESEPGSYEAVKMSPTGEQLLLVSRSIEDYEVDGGWLKRPGDGALYTFQLEGQNLRRIWDGYAHASWAPDGQYIAVWTPLLPDETWLWLTDPTGSVRTPLIKRNVEGDAVGGNLSGDDQ